MGYGDRLGTSRRERQGGRRDLLHRARAREFSLLSEPYSFSNALLSAVSRVQQLLRGAQHL